MEQKQKDNLEYFQNNLNTWLKDIKLKHKFVVICEKEVKGSFDSFEAGLEYASSNFSPSEFIIQQVISSSEQLNFIRFAV